jgi:hypothetical protein
MTKTILTSVSLLVAVSVTLAGPPVPPTPAGVDQVVYARPFVLHDGFRFDWCKEPLEVTKGTILVLKVNPDLVTPRQTEEPVLYVGNQTAMRLNHGNESGYVIAIVPGEVDLTKDPIWFGTPGLPERVDNATVKAEREKADKAGIKPLSAEKAQAARDKGGARINAPDMSALLRTTLAELVEQYSPQEKRLAEAWRVPTVKPADKP